MGRTSKTRDRIVVQINVKACSPEYNKDDKQEGNKIKTKITNKKIRIEYVSWAVMSSNLETKKQLVLFKSRDMELCVSDEIKEKGETQVSC